MNTSGTAPDACGPDRPRCPDRRRRVSLYFSVAGYDEEARVRAGAPGVPLFPPGPVGAPRPVDGPAARRTPTGPENRATRPPRAPDTRRMRIRSAAPGELPALQDIERAAGEPFRGLGMPDVADDEPPALDVLERHGGRAAAGSPPRPPTTGPSPI
ncbi:hypothetical protein GCM10023238_10840 [Streptomyces heliomycini]